MAKTPRSPRKKAPKKRAKSAASNRSGTAKQQNSGKSDAAEAFIRDIKSNMGRPPKLIEDEDLISKIKNLAAIQCTMAQAAAALGVGRTTLTDFLNKNPRSREAWESGPEYGRLALRQMQLATARKGNVRMQIWLGINWLGQTNRVDNRLTGSNGGPVALITNAMTPTEAADAYAQSLEGEE